MRIKNFLMYSIMTQLGKKKSHGSSFLKDLGSVGERGFVKGSCGVRANPPIELNLYI